MQVAPTMRHASTCTSTCGKAEGGGADITTASEYICWSIGLFDCSFKASVLQKRLALSQEPHNHGRPPHFTWARSLENSQSLQEDEKEGADCREERSTSIPQGFGIAWKQWNGCWCSSRNRDQNYLRTESEKWWICNTARRNYYVYPMTMSLCMIPECQSCNAYNDSSSKKSLWPV